MNLLCFLVKQLVCNYIIKIGNLGIGNWEFVETCGEELKICSRKMSASSNGSQISGRSQSVQNAKEIFDTENIKSGPIIYVKEAT